MCDNDIQMSTMTGANRVLIASLGGTELIMSALKNHSSHVGVQESGLAALRILVAIGSFVGVWRFRLMRLTTIPMDHWQWYHTVHDDRGGCRDDIVIGRRGVGVDRVEEAFLACGCPSEWLRCAWESGFEWFVRGVVGVVQCSDKCQWLQMRTWCKQSRLARWK